MERYVRFFKEDINLSSQETIIPKGEKLYHGTGESFDIRKIGTGGYDNILWTTDSIKIARYYIPDFGAYFMGVRVEGPRGITESYLREEQPWYNIVKNQLGISTTLKRSLLDKAVVIKNRQFEIYKQIDAFKKREKELDKQLDDAYAKGDKILYNTLNDEVMKLLGEWQSIEAEDSAQRNIDYNEFLNKAIEKKMNQFGYYIVNDVFKPYVKVSNNTLYPADAKLIGKVVVLTPKHDLKFYNYALGREGDLTDVDYHKLDLFKKLEKEGYDGIVINDFAQSKHWGNYGHIAYGIFKNTIKYLTIQTIRNQTHPED